MKPKTGFHKSNRDISKLFRSVAAALELTPGDNRFRIVAYERAADSIDHSTSDVKDLWDDHRLDDLPGIGEKMAEYLTELFQTGQVKHFQQILKPFPEALFELMEIPGVGPKKAFSLCKALGITKAHGAVKTLETAAKKGHIASIDGFGQDSQAQILQNIQNFRRQTNRLLLPDAQYIAEDVISWMHQLTAVSRIDALGSLRRKSATIGDLDLAVSTTNPKQVIDHFLAYPKKVRTIESGPVSATILLPDGITVDLMTGEPESYGSLLQHFTGSKLHNIALRELAQQKGVSLSEYGVKHGDTHLTFPTEIDLYDYFGLQFIPPELREGGDEIALAKVGRIPKLVELDQIKGDLQIHSNFDTQPSHDLGTSSIDDLASRAFQLGYEYIGLTEHNPSFSQHTISQMMEIIKQKTDTISRYNSKHENSSENYPYVFNGLEIDLRPDGTRALPDSCLELLDYACVSVHSSFSQDRKTVTDRVLAGLNHPKVKFLAHPTGRLLQQREGINLDWDRVFDFCQVNDKWLEINSFPNRLDLPDTLVKQAVKLGVKLVVNTDSHEASHLSNIGLGISVARRGLAQTGNIVNTLPFAKLYKMLGKEVK